MKTIPKVVKFALCMLAANLHGPLSANPECALDGFAGHYIQVYENRGALNDCYHQLIDNLDDARIAQANLTGVMAASREQAGYKVGLTDRKAQELFAITHPLVGVLFRDMLLADGATVAHDSGTSLLVEVDLLVRVKSADINQADSIEDVARHIDAIIPFIELPDLLFRRASKNAAALLLAGNVGARWGVLGAPVKTTNPQDLVDYLPFMTFELSANSGEVIRQGRGSQILGHPLNSVLYLLNELAVRKAPLKPGQLISLGAIGGPAKAEQGQSYTAKYSGYGKKALTVSVTIQ